MLAKFNGFSSSWLGKRLRGHRAAALPPGSALSDLPESIDLDTAKAALEQVNKRLDAELALKSSTETRALTLAGQCTTLLSAITAAVLVESYGSQRTPLILAGIGGGVCLFAAVLFAYSSAKPRRGVVLPGRLPDEMWDDLVAPDMKGAEFMGRLMLSLQDVMVQNELKQDKRATALKWAMLFVRLTVPVACLAALLAVELAPRLGSSPGGIGLSQPARQTEVPHLTWTFPATPPIDAQ
nr:hypothetical protein [uncultured Rhodopila sp.]